MSRGICAPIKGSTVGRRPGDLANWCVRELTPKTLPRLDPSRLDAALYSGTAWHLWVPLGLGACERGGTGQSLKAIRGQEDLCGFHLEI